MPLQPTHTYQILPQPFHPRLVAEQVTNGGKVYGARLLTSTLEEVYVEAVGGETQ